MSTLERIERIVRDTLGDEDVALSETTRASDVPGWDSLAQVTIMFSIEEEFGVHLAAEEFAAFANVGELQRMLDVRLGSSPSVDGSSGT